MKKIWIEKATSFKKAERFNKDYYFSISSGDRLEIVQFLRETYRKLKRGGVENRKGLRGSIKVIQ